MEMQVSVSPASPVRRRARSGGGGKGGRRAVAKNGNASFCESWESCETRARVGGGKVGRRAVAKSGNASFYESCESCETESAKRRRGR